MKSFSFIAVLAMFLHTGASASEAKFQDRIFKIPEGWTVMPGTFECPGSSVTQTLVLRNAPGTIWIIAQALPPTVFAKSSEAIRKEWTLAEAGHIAGISYSVFSTSLSSENKNARAMEFPALHTYFSFLLTTTGRQDKVEAMKYWTPPVGQEYDDFFREAKSVVLSLVEGMKAPSGER